MSFIGTAQLPLPWKKLNETESYNPGQTLENKLSSAPHHNSISFLVLY